MPATIQREAKDLYLLKISGTLEPTDLSRVQNVAATEIEAGAKPRLLVELIDFEGFEQGALWGELDFLFEHINDIVKIAIVGHPQWERDVLAFAGAGNRKAPVKFFPPAKIAEARAWLA